LEHILKSFPWVEHLRCEFPAAQIYVVGGAVRDLMLRGEIVDYDFLIRAVPPPLLFSALQKWGEVVLVGKEFGVFKFYPREGNFRVVDIALPRREIPWMTGGFRDFEIQSDPNLQIEEDLSRRDFTINAMALSVTDGRIIDPFQGAQDLQQRRLRAVGDPKIRFLEDRSRMLRGIRLSCQLQFDMTPQTWAALKEGVPQIDGRRADGSFVVPREVIAKELLRALSADPVRALDLLDQSGLLKMLLPEILLMKGCPQPPEFHSEGDVFTHTRLALGNLRSPQFTEEFGNDPAPAELILAVLLHDVGKPYTIQTPERDGTDRIRFNEHDRVGAEIADRICGRLKLSQLPREGPLHIDPTRLSWLIRQHLLLVHGRVEEMRATTLERYFLNPKLPGDLLRKLMFVDGLASVPSQGSGQLEGYHALKRRLEQIQSLAASKEKAPKPFVSGEEVMSLLHLPPGPEVGRLLLLLREEQLGGRIRDREDAVGFLKKQSSHPP